MRLEFHNWEFDFLLIWIDGRAGVRRLRQACLHWSDAHGEKDSLLSGVAGAQSAAKFLPLLSRKACYRLALLLGSLGPMLDHRGRRVALSNLRVVFGDEISSERRAQIVRESYQHFARTHARFFLEPAPDESEFLALR